MMRARPRAGLTLGLALAVSLAAAPPARADSHAEAVVLFDQGIKDMRAGRLDKACGELQSSLDLVKDSGTKGALARCHGLAGRVASAWLLWRELADTAPKADLRTDAAAQAAKLEPRLPKYTLRPAVEMANLVVEINGRDVAVNMSVPVPIDPGTVSVTAIRRDADRDASAPWRHDYTIAEGQTLAIEIPKLALLPAPAKPVDPSIAAHAAADADTEHRRHRRHVIAGVLGAVAVGAAGAGGYFGYDASSKYSDAKTTCGGSIDHCDASRLAASKRQVDHAKTSATISTALFGAAGGLAVVAIVVWATAPSIEHRSVSIAPTAGNGSFGLVLGGAF